MKPIIFAIVGASGSGKTLMAEYLKDIHGIPTIVSYTTRPMRPGEIDGRDHYFVAINEKPSDDKLLASTHFGDYDYWTLLSQVDECKQVTYVIDERGLIGLMRNYGDLFNIIPILVKRPHKDIEESIGSDRIIRDNARDHLDSSVFKAVILNDSTIEEFNKRITITLNSLKKWQHQKTNNQ